jgi:hypothetical protein
LNDGGTGFAVNKGEETNMKLSFSDSNKQLTGFGKMVVFASFTVFVLGVATLLAWGIPTYGAWAKQTQVDAAMSAEVTRALGTAKANRLVADSLKGQGEYLRYLWIQRLSEDDKTIMYIPTDGAYPMFDSAWIEPGAACGD